MDARQILLDAAQRPLDSALQVLDGIEADLLNRMPDDTHSSIAWLLWHAARQMDVQVAALAGTEPVWQANGWVGRFDLDRPERAMGFGDGPADIAKVRVDDPELLSGYLSDAVAATRSYIEQLSGDDLDEVIDQRFGGVARGVRLVSVIDDAVSHIAQAAYLRGLLAGWTIGY